MPIMDGGTSTTRIRSFENSRQYIRIPPKHNPNGRIAVFAVSATLIEAKRVEYMETGFDGWILKPVDFKRLDTMMRGIGDFEVRRQVAYAPGSWEKGGWFTTGVREEGGQSKRLNSTKDVDIQARKCSPPGEWLSEAWGDGTMERSEQEKSPNGEDINEHGRPKI